MEQWWAVVGMRREWSGAVIISQTKSQDYEVIPNQKAQTYLQTKITDCVLLMSRRGSRFLNCGMRRLFLLSPSIINFINFINNK